MKCMNCGSTFIHSTLPKWSLLLIYMVLPIASIFLGIAYESWLVFLVLIIVVPLLANLYFSNYASIQSYEKK